MSTSNNIDIKEIPFDQFKKLGLEKKDILSMPPLVITQLLSGKKTNLITFEKADMGEGITMNNLSAKLSLSKDSDGNATLNIHPIQPSAPLSIQGREFTKAEFDILKRPESPILELTVKNPQGFDKQVLVQYDRQLNDWHVQTPEKSPEFMNGYKLTDTDKANFSKGKEIQTPDGPIRKDFNSPLGYQAPFLIIGAATVPHLALATFAIIKTVSRLRDMFGRNNQQQGRPSPAKIVEDPVFSKDFTNTLEKTVAKLNPELSKNSTDKTINKQQSIAVDSPQMEQLQKALQDYKSSTPKIDIDGLKKEIVAEMPNVHVKNVKPDNQAIFNDIKSQVETQGGLSTKPTVPVSLNLDSTKQRAEEKIDTEKHSREKTKGNQTNTKQDNSDWVKQEVKGFAEKAGQVKLKDDTKPAKKNSVKVGH